MIEFFFFFIEIPGGAGGKEPTCQSRRHRTKHSVPGLGRSLEEDMATSVLLPGKSHGQRSLEGYSAAAAAAKSLQSCPTLCNPINGSPPGSPNPGILQARTLEWIAISFSNA